MSDECEHLDFEVWAEVSRLTDVEGGPVTGYTADLKVNCSMCKLPFEWVGLPIGTSPGQPMGSLDGIEMRAPIRPRGAPDAFGMHRTGFHVQFRDQ